MGKGIQKPRTTYAFEYNEDIVPARPAVAMALRKPKSLCYDFHRRNTKALKSADTVYYSGLLYPSCHVAGSSPQADLPAAVLFRDVAIHFISQLNRELNPAGSTAVTISLPLGTSFSPHPLLTLSGF